MIFEWHGDEVLAKLRQAEKGGLQETDEAIIEEDKRLVAVLTGALQSDQTIIQPPTDTGDGFKSLVGSENLPYAAIQEVGPADGRPYAYRPHLRPAMDLEAPRLAERIKKRM